MLIYDSTANSIKSAWSPQGICNYFGKSITATKVETNSSKKKDPPWFIKYINYHMPI